MEDKNEKKVGRMSIDDMIALYYIVDEFDEFNEKLNENLRAEKEQDALNYFINKLSMVSYGETVIGWKSAKNFYKQYKNIIDTINKYSRLEHFLCYNYVDRESSCIDEVYKYLIDHKDNLEEIIVLLNKIKSLDIEQVKFSESLDFTEESYSMYNHFDDNMSIIFLDNMYALPNYPIGIIKYKTKESNYKMSLRVAFQEFPKYSRSIELNSLLFSTDRLPDEITKDTIYKKILKLIEAQVNNCINIANAINLEVCVDDLYAQFLKTCHVVDNLKEYKDTDLLKYYLERMKEFVDLLKKGSCIYKQNLLQDDNDITEEQLDSEKEKYLKRRFWQNIDID